MIVLEALKAEQFSIRPSSEHEKEYGKPALLTDCEIALILDSLKYAEPETECGEEALRTLYVKMLGLFGTD